MAGRLDGVIDPAEVSFGLAQQQHRGAVGGEGFGGSCANAAAGTGDQNHAALEQVGASGVVVHGGNLISSEAGNICMGPTSNIQQLHRARSSTARSSKG